MEPEKSKPATNPFPTTDQPAAKTNEYLFFNVMPKSESADPSRLTNPTLSVQAKDPAAPTSGKIAELWRMHKLTILIVAFVVLAGAGSLGYVFYLQNNADKQALKNAPQLVDQEKKPPVAPAGAETDSQWQKKFFNSESCQQASVCGGNADPDKDGLDNQGEYRNKTDPNNPDSDNDGLSDGDEISLFGSDPLLEYSGADAAYSDGEYAKGGYDIQTGQKYSSEQLAKILDNMKQFGVHDPTVKNLGELLISLYGFTDWQREGQNQGESEQPPIPESAPTTTPLEGFDLSVGARQDRDAQRSAAIKNIGIALIKFNRDSKKFPPTSDFLQMFSEIKVYLKVATNPQDPVNKSPYVYGYEPSGDGKDFTLSFYSEVAEQLIKKRAADAQKDLDSEQAALHDDRRKNDLETMRTALLLYSNQNAAGNQDYVFPTVEKYKTELVPEYIPQIPKDPKTGQDYPYQVSETFETFTIKAALDEPSSGTTGYLCNQEECRPY